jgi:hypothetical protein
MAPTSMSADHDQLVPERSAAAFLGLTPKALQARRLRGEEPEFIKLGSGPKAPVRYSMRVLREMVKRGVRRSTSDPGSPVAETPPTA